MAKRRKKGHARKGRARGRALRRRFGHSTMPSGSVRMNVSGQLVLDPEKLEEVVEKVVERAAEDVIPEAVEAAVEETVPQVVEETVPEAVDEAIGG